MRDKLFIGVLGAAKSGKSHTFYTLFGQEVRTGRRTRRLYLHDKVYVDVFLINRSPLRQHRTIQSILRGQEPNIILSSLQYQHGVEKTLQYLKDHGYFLYIQWLNPGYSDEDVLPLFKDANLLGSLLNDCSMVGIRNGKSDASERVLEIKDYIYQWARGKGLLMKRGRPYVEGEGIPAH